MTYCELDKRTSRTLRRLIAANYLGRDQLYAASDAIEGPAPRGVFRRLAQRLGGNAADLQQILMGYGSNPVDISDITSRGQSAECDAVKKQRSRSAVIAAAEQCEQSVRLEYDRAAVETDDAEARQIFVKQKEVVSLGEQLLRTMRDVVVQ